VKQYRQLTRHASDGTTTDDDRYDPAHATEDALLTPEEPTDWPWPVLFPTPHKGTPTPTTPEELAAADPEEISVELTTRETSDALQAARAFRDTIETAKNTFDEAQAAFTAATQAFNTAKAAYNTTVEAAMTNYLPTALLLDERRSAAINQTETIQRQLDRIAETEAETARAAADQTQGPRQFLVHNGDHWDNKPPTIHLANCTLANKKAAETWRWHLTGEDMPAHWARTRATGVWHLIKIGFKHRWNVNFLPANLCGRCDPALALAHQLADYAGTDTRDAYLTWLTDTETARTPMTTGRATRTWKTVTRNEANIYHPQQVGDPKIRPNDPYALLVLTDPEHPYPAPGTPERHAYTTAFAKQGAWVTEVNNPDMTPEQRDSQHILQIRPITPWEKRALRNHPIIELAAEAT